MTPPTPPTPPSRRRRRVGLTGRTARETWEGRFGPNMTPMVDIVLVILIFFMAGTTFLGQEWFLRSESFRSARVPGRPDALDLPPVWLTISLSVGDGGRTLFAGLDSDRSKRLDLAAFGERLREFARGTDTAKIIVVLVPDPAVPYKDVVAVHEACAAAGIERVGISQ